LLQRETRRSKRCSTEVKVLSAAEAKALRTRGRRRAVASPKEGQESLPVRRHGGIVIQGSKP
jgi:hypothetical protein